jgi:hypothetical protein
MRYDADMATSIVIEVDGSMLRADTTSRTDATCRAG